MFLDLITISVLCVTVFFRFLDAPLPSSWRISHIIQPLLVDLGSPFVDYASHYSSTCLIRRPPKFSMSYGNQDSTVQGSSPHKSGQVVWWGALNVVAATIPPITSGLTPSLKHFLYSVVPSGNVSLTWPQLASSTLPSECMVFSKLYQPPRPQVGYVALLSY